MVNKWLKRALVIGALSLAAAKGSECIINDAKDRLAKRRDAVDVAAILDDPNVSWKELVPNDCLKHVKAPKETLEGKLERTYRWDPISTAVEERCELEDGLMSALIMRESYGNPCEFNSRDDGGVGIVMLSPGIAKQYGLKTAFDSDKTGKDMEHGRKMRGLGEEHNYQFSELVKYDDRFNGQKAILVAGMFLRDSYNRSEKKFGRGDWDWALADYRWSTPPANFEDLPEVLAIRKYQLAYLQMKKEKGQYVDRAVLARLERQFGGGFRHRWFRGFDYVVEPGDSCHLIARRFNDWDKERGDSYEEVSFRDIYDSKGKEAGASIEPGQLVRVKVKRK